MPLNIPNLLTWLRIVLIPLMVGIYYLPDQWLAYDDRNVAATAVFVFAAVTDWLDGYLARALNQMSAFGAFLDPVADKLMVAAALIVIGREIAISALREWMAKVGQAKSVAVAFIGKLKTVFQMIAIPLLLYEDNLFGVLPCLWLGTILINVAAVLTVISMLYYLRRAVPGAPA